MSRGNRHRQSRVLRDGPALAKRQAQEAAAQAAADEAARAQAAATAAAAEAANNHAQLADTLNQVSIWAYGLPDGDSSEKALELLANLGWCIGLGATIAVRLDPASPQARRLHGALRTVHAMCLAGYRWRSEMAAPMDAAAREANALTMANGDLARQWKDEAYWLTERIKTRSVQAADVAGAEVYREVTRHVLDGGVLPRRRQQLGRHPDARAADGHLVGRPAH